jgi:hypothetical protein
MHLEPKVGGKRTQHLHTGVIAVMAIQWATKDPKSARWLSAPTCPAGSKLLHAPSLRSKKNVMQYDVIHYIKDIGPLGPQDREAPLVPAARGVTARRTALTHYALVAPLVVLRTY